MRTAWIVLVGGVLAVLPGALAAMEAPEPVAPGSRAGMAVVRGTCPTFHWSAVGGARSYDLAVFRLGSDGATAEELYRVSLPGGAQGWTPTVEHCLVPGQRYAWTLRAIGRGTEPGRWSEARLFEIASAPSVEQVEQALTVLRRWLAEERNDDGESEVAGSTRRAPQQPPGESPSPVDVARQMSEDTESFLEHLVGTTGPAARRRGQPVAAPTPGIASLTFDEQLHLGANSQLFKEGELLLWENKLAGITSYGRGALGANTSGEGNTATGLSALATNTTGTSNAAFGTSALRLNTIATDNTGVGYIALELNTTGERNTAVGSEAMHLNTTGSFNTAFGWRAMKDNTSGALNTALGIKALHSNLIGTNNTAIGVESIGENTTGDNNVAVGFAAMHDNTIGSHNTGIGFRALRVNTDGNNNVGVGNDTLFFNTTGERNTAVGNNAGLNATTGSDNIYIGSGADGVAAEGNTIRIGGTTVGTGSGQQDRTFINGITGVNVSGAAVMVGSDGQLGVTVSSRHHKLAVETMGEMSRRLLELRPVTFHYRDGSEEGPWPLEFGLIAEEVAEVFPELVIYDDRGQPQTVKYHLLATILLNELQALEERFERLGRKVDALEGRSLPLLISP